MRRQRIEWLQKVPAPINGKAEPPKPTNRPFLSGMPTLNKFERERRAKAYAYIKRMKAKA